MLGAFGVQVDQRGHAVGEAEGIGEETPGEVVQPPMAIAHELVHQSGQPCPVCLAPRWLEPGCHLVAVGWVLALLTFAPGPS